MAKLFANSGDPRSVVSDLGLHCLPVTILRFPDYNGYNINDFLFILSHTNPFLKKEPNLQGKNLFQMGANSFFYS